MKLPVVSNRLLLINTIVSNAKSKLLARYTCALVALLFFSAATAQQLHIVVPNFPPYTYSEDNQIKGLGIELAQKIFADAGMDVRFTIEPNYAKTVHTIKSGQGDGFLLASQNGERDRFARFSNPLVINRWVWYTLADSTLQPTDKAFKQQALISTHFNTNTHKWLIKNDYKVEAAMDLPMLPEMLVRERVDAVFIAELVFDQALAESNLDPKLFKKHIEIEKPFGIYISKQYLKRHPDTLERINKSIEEVLSSAALTAVQH